jgi:hypothetical protein
VIYLPDYEWRVYEWRGHRKAKAREANRKGYVRNDRPKRPPPPPTPRTFTRGNALRLVTR